MKILINALSGIGDAIMFSPMLRIIKKQNPEAKIDMMVMFPQVKDFFINHEEVNTIYFIDFLNQSWIKSLNAVLRLRKIKYDVSVNVYPSNRKEYNIISKLIGAKLRVATRYEHLSAYNFDFLNTNLVKEVKDRHNVLENFELVKTFLPDISEKMIGNYDIRVSIEDEVWSKRFLIDNMLTDQYMIGFHAGSATFKNHIHKRWNVSKFSELATQLHKNFLAYIFLFGTEKDVNEEIYKSNSHYSYIPPIKSITQTAALMERCKLFISNDTALMHLASALKIPTVAIFGYTDYKELHPWKSEYRIVRKDLPCSPCFYNSPRPAKCIYRGTDAFKCIESIEVEEVLKSAEELIQKIPR